MPSSQHRLMQGFACRGASVRFILEKKFKLGDHFGMELARRQKKSGGAIFLSELVS